MNFWLGLLGVIVACAVVYWALSINGVTEPPAGDGHDSHGHH
ncbi:MAG TPA: hypothetical protein VIL07_04240 [Symbiobacteriaceae bacterium]